MDRGTYSGMRLIVGKMDWEMDWGMYSGMRLISVII